MDRYVLVAEEENEEPIELPVEEDGTLLLTTVVAQFAGASGLKFRNPETNAWRGVRVADGRLYPCEEVWGNYTYITVYPKGCVPLLSLVDLLCSIMYIDCRNYLQYLSLGRS